MNKIFKVIFNRTTQKMEVVSELARSQGKAASSTDERGTIKLAAAGILGGATLIGGMAAFMLSATPAEAAVIIDTITGTNGNIVVTTNSSVPTNSATNPYNYFNPGSLSYADRTQPQTSGVTTGVSDNSRLLYKSNTTSAVVIGHYATALEDKNGNKASGVAIGDYSHAGGALSLAIGPFSRTADTGSVALGTSARSEGFNSFAAMRQSAAIADYSAAIGSSSWANQKASFAIGASATALGNRSFAIGSGTPQTVDGSLGAENRRSIYDGQNNTLAVGSDAFSIGTKAKTNGESAFAIGTNAQAGGFVENAEGKVILPDGTTITIPELKTVVNANSSEKANNAYALGTNTRALSNDTVAFSTNATAKGDGAIAFGVDSKSNGTGAIAFGNISNATGANAISIGWNATAKEEKVISIGAHSIAEKAGGIAIGETAKSSGNQSVTVGYNSTVSKDNATAIGSHAKVEGLGGTSVGYEANAKGNYSTAMAYKSEASGNYSLAVGANTTVSGDNSGAFGQNNRVSGTDTFVLGSNVTANTNGSVILGNHSTVAEAKAVASKEINGVTYNFAGHDSVVAGDYVSVGSDANERQIKFVAPGEISNTSTDAINGSQLYAVMTEGSWTVKASGSNKDSKVNFGDVVDFKSSDKSVTITPNFADKENSLDFTVNVDGTTITRDATTGKLSAVAAKVEKGTNIASVDAKKDTTGITTYTINADGTTASHAESSKDYLTVTAGAKDPVTNKTNYEVKLTDKALTEFKKDDDTKTGVVANPKNSEYLTVTEHTTGTEKREGDDRTYIVGLSEKAITDFTKDTHVTGGSVVYDNQGNATATLNKNDGTTAAVTGIKNNFVTTSATDADGKKATLTRNDGGTVEIDLSKTVTTAVNEATEKGFGLTAQDGQTVKKKLGEAVEVVGGNNNINTTATDGKVKVNLNNTLDLTTGGSVTIGDTKVDQNGLTINGGPNVTKSGIDAGSKKITNVADGDVSATSKDAVNGSQLYATNQNVTNLTNKVEGGFNITADNGTPDNVKLGDTIKFTDPDANIITTVSDNQIKFALNSTLSVGGKDGKDGSIGIKGQDGENGVTINGNGTVIVGKDGQPGSIGINGKDGTIGINGKDGANATMTVEKGAPGLDGASGKDGKTGEKTTRIVYTNEKGEKEEVANLNDGLRFTGNDDDTENKHKLNSLVTVRGEGVTKEQSKTFESATGNINVKADGNSILEVQLAKNLNLTNGGSVVIGNTTVNNDGLNITNGPSVTQTGINAGDKKITNVSNGTISADSKDAVNGSQLHETNQNVTNVSNNVTKLDEFVKKGFNITADNGQEDNVQLGEKITYTSTDKNIITTVTNNQIDFALNSTLSIGKAGADGKDGTIGVNGKDGSAVVLNGKDGSIGLTGPKGENGQSATANVTVKNGQPGVDGADGKTRIIYETKDKNGNPVTEEVATLNDGLKFGANTGDVHNAKLNTQVNVKGAEGNTEWNKFDAGKNIMTQINGNNITVALAKNVNLTEDGSVTIGGTNITNEGITINNGPKITNKDGSVSVANQDGSPTKITNVKAGDVNNTSTDAVNGSQLYTVQEIANAGWNLTINEGQNSSNVKPKETVDLNNKDGNIQITKDAHNVTFALNNELTIGGPGKNGADGKDGSIGVKGADGSTGVALNGKDGSIGINGKDGANANITVKNGKPGVDGVDGTTKTRIVYETKDGPEEVATLNDGLKFVGDDNKVIAKKLNQTLNVTGGADLTKLADNNIGVVNTNDGLVVKLSKDVNLTKDGSVTIGNTTLNDSGLTIANGPSVTNTGISAGNKQITNVSSGLTDANGQKTDLANATTTNAVNVGDLKDTVNNLTNATTGGFGLTGDDKNTEVKQDLGKTIQVKGKDGVTVTANVAEKALEIALAGDVSVSGKDGKDGSIGVKGTDGKDGVTINGNGTVVVGKDGAPGKIGINGKDGANATMTVEKGAPGLDGAQGKDGKDGTQTTRIVYTNETGGKEEVATLNDGLRFTGNNEVENKHKLNSLVTIIGEGVNKEQSNAFQSAAGNINVVADGNGNLTVKLAKNLNLTDSGSVTIGGTNITNEGITINNGPKITNEGGNVKVGDVNGAPVKITNVKEGDLSETSKDAVNGSQLYATNQNVTNLSNKVAQGFNITADNGTADNVQLGETITYTSSDKNIVTTVSNNTIDFKLSDAAVDKFTVKYFSVNSTVPENRLNDGAKGVNSIAIGPNATSVDQGAIALGTNSNANGNAAAALGVNSKAEGIQATAVGSQANATANGATAIGRETTASAGDATAVGSNANATKEKATALGVGSRAEDRAALAVGTNATASAQSAVAVGTQSVADKQFAVAVGMGAQATLENSVALGSESTVTAATPTSNATVGGITYTGFAGANENTNYVVSVGSAGKERQIQNVAAGRITSDSTDAINGSQLYAVADKLVKTGFNITADNSGLDAGAKEDNVKLGETVKYTSTDTNVVTTVTNNTIDFGLADNISVGGKPGKDGTPGKDGSIGVKGADGKDGVTIKPEAIVFHGVDGVNGKDGADGKDGKDGAASIKVEKGAKGLDGNDGKDGESKTRIVYEKPNGEKEEVATLNDGLKFGANNGTVHNAKLNTQVDVKGAAGNTDWTKFDAGQNVMTQIVDNTITVALAKDLTGLNSATFGTEGDSTVINKDGVTIAKKDPNDANKSNVTLTEDGLSNGGNQITNVDSGLKDKNGQPVDLKDAEGDVLNNAVNVGDLKNTAENLSTNAFGLKDKEGNEFKQNLGTTAQITGDSNINTKVVDVQNPDGTTTKALEVSLNNDLSVGKDGKAGAIGVKGQDGKDGVSIKGDDGKNGVPGEASVVVGRNGADGIDGKVGVNGKDGASVVLNGKDGSIGLTGPKGADGQPGASTNIAVKDGKQGVDGTGKDGLPGDNGETRIVYKNGDKEEQVANLNDGLIFTGNNADTLNRHKLNTVVNVVGEGVDKAASAVFKSAAGNINVKADGTDKLEIQLNRELKDLTNAKFVEYKQGDDGKEVVDNTKPSTELTNKGITITPANSENGADAKPVSLTDKGLDNGNNQIVNVDSGLKDKDGNAVELKNASGDVLNNAVNVGDLKNTAENLSTDAFGLKDKEGNEFKQNLGTTAQITGDSNINTKVVDVQNPDGTTTKALEVSLNSDLSVGKDGKAGTIGIKGQDGKDGVSIKGDNGKDGTPGEATITVGRDGKDGDDGIDGKVGVNGKDGSAVVLNGKDGSIGLNGKDGKDGLTFKSADGAQGVNGKDGENGLPGQNGTTRIVYQPTDKDGNPQGEPETVATLNDGLIFAGNNDKLNRHKLNSVVNIVGEVAQGINDKESSENFKSAAGNINVVANEKDQLEIQLNRDLKDLTSAKFVEYKPGENGGKDVVDNTKPSTEITNNGMTITPAKPADGADGEVKAPVKLTQDGLDNGNNQIVNVKSGIDGINGQPGKDGKAVESVNDLTDEQLEKVGTNAANIKDVRNATDSLINKGFNITADNSELADGAKEDNVKLGETVNYTSKDKNIITTVSDNAIDFALNNNLTIGGPGKDGKDGVDGKVGVKGADGTAGVTLNGKDGSIGLTGPKGQDGKDGASATISVKDGAKGLAGNDGKDGESKTRIVYEKPDGTTEEVATLNDGLRFVGDDGKVIDKKLNETLQISGGDTDLDDLSDDNIGVVNKDGKLMVKLARNIDLTDEGSVTIGDTYIDTNVVGVGDSALTGDSLTVGGDNSITVDGNKGTIGGLTNKTFDPNNFTSGQAATEDQLKQVYDVANSGWDIAANGNNSTNVGPKGKVSFNNEDGNIIITKETTDNNVTFALNNDLTIGGPGKDGKPGKDGAIGVKGADGTTGVTLNGKDGTIGINGKDGSNGTMTFEQGKPGVDGKDGETKTRIVYETKDKDGNPVKEEVATLNDGLKFVGDDGKVITKKLNETLSITGGEKDATKLSDANNIGVVNNNGTLTVKLAKDIDLTKDGSVTIGDTTVNNDGLTIKDGPSVTKAGINAGDKKITNVQDGEISATSKDAVNGSQLYQVQEVANAGWNLTANGKDKGNVKPGATVDLNNKDGNIIITKEGNNVTFGLNNNLTIGGKDGKDGQIGIAGKDGKDGVTIKGDGTITAGRDGKDGVDGSIGATGKDGASVVLNGKDGSIGLTGPKGADGKPGASANIAVKDGAEGVDGTNGKDGLPGENGKTRIVYETKDKDGKTVTEQVATLNDGLIFSGNNEDVKNRQKLNTEVKVKGEGVDKTASENFKSASGNINVKANGTDTLEVQLAKAIDLTEDGSVTTGDTTVNNNGLTIKDGPSVTKGGIDAKGTKITNVKDGDVTATSKDAVNGSQLYNAMQNTGWDLTVDGNVAETSEKGAQRVNNNGKVAVSGGKNIVVSRKGSTVEVATSSNPEFDSVKVGGTTISSTVAKDGVNELNIAGSKNAQTRITNVAPGVKGTDAVNVNQLKGAENRLNNRISNVDKDLRAGIAGALAAGNLYHVTQPGKSMVSAGVGAYRGQGAIAVGYSRLSDNGKVGIKFSVNSNSRGDTGAAASVGYQW
ncbi:Haemagglutinin [Mannheimia haemolytica]|uniref:Haemagglutinin n=1 Tax=Mannheimia haemolytica TaxID=75985 RepID=A0A448T3Z2_MANHA|nr:YadA-like family protein [Mannheimia haemolytica]VEI74662.1 Haemagglutinin [Mannheimia haemolytica]